MDSNESFPTIENEDFFAEMYSDSTLKQLTIGIFFFGSIVGVLSEIGIIWYERNGDHNYRTVLNQLFSTISLVTLCYLVFVYIPDGIRYLHGPLPAAFCDIHNFLKNFFGNCFILSLDCIICLRYIFIFKWGKFSVFDENLVALFLQISILALSFWMALVKKMSVGREPMNYYMCCGKNPNEKNAADEKNDIAGQYDTTGILALISFTLHLIVSAKIFLYQRRMEKREENVELGRLNNGNSQGSNEDGGNRGEVRRKSLNFPKSMADLTTTMFSLSYSLVLAIATTAMNQTSPVDLNQYQNRWLAYFNQIIAFSFAISTICIQYYARNVAIRNAIWRNLKAYIPYSSNIR